MKDIFETFAEVPAGTMVKAKNFYVIKPAMGNHPLITSICNGKRRGWIQDKSASGVKGPFKALTK